MRIYLLLACIIAIAHTHYCSQLGDSSLAKLSSCVVTTPAPQLKWSMNITLLEDYDWRGAEEVRYFYLTINDEPIFETCYQGQTIKGKYTKGTSLLVEQLCFDFKPAISKGDKLYLMLFWDRPASQKQIVHLSFTANGQMQPVALDKEEKKRVEAAISKHLVSE